MDKNTSAPLKVWLIVIVIASIVIAADQLFYDKLSFLLTTKESEANKAIVKDLSSPKLNEEYLAKSLTSKVKILALGTSRLGSGMGFSSEINKKLSECLGGADVSFAFEWTPNAELETYLADVVVFRLIQDYQPTHIILEKNLLLSEPSENKIERRRKDARNDLKQLLEKGPGDRNYRTLKPKDNRWNPKHDSSNIKRLAGYYMRKGIRQYPLEPIVDSVLNGLSQNAQIIALEMPFSYKIDSIKTQYFAEEEAKIISEMKQKYGMGFILSNHRFPFRLYRDRNHLNKNGQEIYTDWMIEELCDFIRKNQ